MPPFDHVTGLLPGAIAIALMVYLETITVARTVRTAAEPPITNDQELFAVGAASFAGAFFQSLPAAGGFSQTAVNQRSGACSQVSELTTVLLAVLVALFFGAVLDDLPQATLGAMVFVAVLGLIKPADWVRLAKVSRLELIVAVVTAGVALVAGMLIGVAFGVVGTLYVLLHEINNAPTVELQPNAAGLMAPATADSRRVPRLLVLRVLVPLYTGNARVVQRAVLAAVDDADVKPVVVILDATAIAGVTTTVIEAGRETEQQLAERGVELWLASLEPHAEAGMRQAPRWQELVATGRIHATVEEAVTAFRQRQPAASDERGSG
jgi:sulfate permease, SulP family